MPLNPGWDWSPRATHGFYKNLRITSLSKAPEPLQGEFTGAHLRLPSPELAPSGVELPGLGAEKGFYTPECSEHRGAVVVCSSRRVAAKGRPPLAAPPFPS